MTSTATPATTATASLAAPRPRWPVALASALLVVPRASVTYGLYVAGPLLLVDWRSASRASWALLLGLVGLSGCAVALAAAAGTVTWTGWVLELALVTPLLLVACGFRLVPHLELRWFLRSVAGFLLAVNLVWMVVDGLPYVQTLPDAMRGLYGLGGARIVTVLGFLCLLQEIRLWRTERRSVPWLLVAVVDFLLPSYVIGIVVGLIALALPLSRRTGRLALLLVAAVPSLDYAVTRAGRLNPIAEQVTGQHPKAFAYESAVRAWSESPSSVLAGAGPGQFTSTPQDWVDPFVSSDVAPTQVVELPGLVMSSVRAEFLSPYTSQLESYPFALASAASQPVTGLGTLLVEWGPLALVLVLGVLWNVLGGGRRNAVLVSAVAFVAGLNAVDQWVDSPWLWWAVAALCAVSSAEDAALVDVPEHAGDAPRRGEVLASRTRRGAPARVPAR